MYSSTSSSSSGTIRFENHERLRIAFRISCCPTDCHWLSTLHCLRIRPDRMACLTTEWPHYFTACKQRSMSLSTCYWHTARHLCCWSWTQETRRFILHWRSASSKMVGCGISHYPKNLIHLYFFFSYVCSGIPMLICSFSHFFSCELFANCPYKGFDPIMMQQNSRCTFRVGFSLKKNICCIL